MSAASMSSVDDERRVYELGREMSAASMSSLDDELYLHLEY